MAKKGRPARVNSALEKAMTEEIKEISKKAADGKFLYSVIDRTRVYSQALKLEAIKASLPDNDWGSEFDKGDE